ncbi:MAG: fimbrillin family protein, partial [Duncaniella sp.]|nr:fimbrillin family protein [Duncaniella sp.]
MQYFINKLLYISLLAFAVLALHGCSSDISDIVPDEEQQELKFVTAEISRALTSDINYSGSKFALFGDIKYLNSIPVEIFHNVDVTCDGNAWNYAGTQYWYPKHEHSFAAVYPAEALKNKADSRYVESNLSFSYTIPVTNGNLLDRTGTFDLLAATHRRLYDVNTNT